MNPKTLAIVAIAAIAIVAGAVVTSKKESAAVIDANVETKREHYFPGLEAKINDVEKLYLEDSTTSITLVRTASGWGWADRGNYPAKMEVVRQALLDLAGIKKIERKSSNPENFEAMNLKAPKDGGTSRIIRAFDKSGGVVAELLVGKQRTGLGLVGMTNHFVRPPAENQSWIVEGDLRFIPAMSRWVEQSLFAVQQNRVRRVTLESPDGKKVVFERDTPENADFRLLDIPADRELDTTKQTEPSFIFSYNRFDDVRPRAEAKLDTAKKSLAVFETFDGLKMTATVHDTGAKKYVTFDAAADDAQIAARNKQLQDKWDADQAAAAAKADAATSGTLEKTPTPTPKPGEGPKLVAKDDIAKEVEAIKKAAADWAFVLPPFTMEKLTRQHDYFTKAKESKLAGPSPDPTPAAEAAPEATPAP